MNAFRACVRKRRKEGPCTGAMAGFGRDRLRHACPEFTGPGRNIPPPDRAFSGISRAVFATRRLAFIPPDRARALDLLPCEEDTSVTETLHPPSQDRGARDLVSAGRVWRYTL